MQSHVLKIFNGLCLEEAIHEKKRQLLCQDSLVIESTRVTRNIMQPPGCFTVGNSFLSII